MAPNNVVAFLASLWLGTIIFFIFLWLNREPRKVIINVDSKRKVRLFRRPYSTLCTAHLEANLRPGRIAFLDKEKCEVCIAPVTHE